MLKPKCFIIGMILSSSLQVKAFIPNNNTAACVAAATLAVNATNAANVANANKESERDNDKELDIVTTAFGFIFLLCSSALLFMCMFQLAGLFLGKNNDT